MRVFLWMALFGAVCFSHSAYAIDVELKKVSGGNPAPGTTVSLQDKNGNLLQLELDPIEESDGSALTEDTFDSPSSIRTQDPSEFSFAVSVWEDGSARFSVSDDFLDVPLVLSVNSGTGQTLERRTASRPGCSRTCRRP